MRLFFAVLLPEEARESAARAQEAYRLLVEERGVKWVSPEQFHYTLKFLGETPETRLPALMEAAQQVAARQAPFSLTLAGVGAFPSTRRPQNIWIGTTDGFPLLTQLAESLEKAMAEIGFPPSEHPFRPHLTLARVKTREAEKSVANAFAAGTAEQNRADKIGVIRVENFVLMKSALRPHGPIYAALETFALTAT